MKAVAYLLGALAATGFAAPVGDKRNPQGLPVRELGAADTDKRSYFNGYYIGPGEDGDAVEETEKRSYFDGIYIGPGEEGDTVEDKEKRSYFDGIYIGPGEEGETAE